MRYIGKATAHIAKLVHVRVLFTSAARLFGAFVSRGAAAEFARSDFLYWKPVGTRVLGAPGSAFTSTFTFTFTF